MPVRTRSVPGVASAGHLYLATVIISGILAIGACLVDVQFHPLPLQWYLLAVLTLVSGSATVNLPTVGASISVSETFVFASVLLFGPSAGTITVALDGLVISFWMAKRRPEWYRALFNMAAPAISIWVAAQLLFAIARIRPLFEHQSPVNTLILPLVIFAIVYFGLNSWLIAFAVAFEARISPYRIWRQNFLWLSLNYFSGASVALLLVAYTNNVDLTFIAVIVPLLLVLYLTFKTTMGRVEDAHSHLQQVNRLYLSTIETLAVAIDAKDQVTHGHIRRVQQLAVRLARELGVSDERLLKAIEAAALLHDMGKLAVPEYILNKPGKLTAAEFEKMKLHASVGAEILAPIEFPYPVVPIVRHHHENWDGAGYPDGLRGTAIPIGARILSVVDCFDALISDRPYRPRLSDDEALAILVERRGSMYDPWVVDTFLRVHNQIAPDGSSSVPDVLATGVDANHQNPSAAGHDRQGHNDSVRIHELAQVLACRTDLDFAARVIARQLRRLMPSRLCVFFLYDAAKDDLVATFANGEGASIPRGMRIGLGQRLSGWVAANRQTIANSDAQLDLGDAARSPGVSLRGCMSTPLIEGNALIGVLTVYSSDSQAFEDEHKRTFENIGRVSGRIFGRRSIESDNVVRHDRSQLPSFDQLEHFAATNMWPIERDELFTLLFIKTLELTKIKRIHGREALVDVHSHVFDQISASMAPADIIFSFGSDGYVVLLESTEPNAATTVAQRLHEVLFVTPLQTDAALIEIRVSVSSVAATIDGESLRELIERAQSPDTRIDWEPAQFVAR